MHGTPYHPREDFIADLLSGRLEFLCGADSSLIRNPSALTFTLVCSGLLFTYRRFFTVVALEATDAAAGVQLSSRRPRLDSVVLLGEGGERELRHPHRSVARILNG